MRTELKKFEEYYWGLEKEDFKITCNLVKSFMKAYWNGLSLPKENQIKTSEVDLFIAQHYRETQLLLQFGIWRLQSIFESLIKTTFNIKRSGGINSLIKELKRKGFVLIKESELLQWTKLRNELSHNAPEM